MFEKIKLFLDLLRQGSEVADVSKWKSHKITAAKVVAVMAVLVAILKSFGYHVPLSDADTASIGVALYALLNWLLDTVTDKERGLPAKPAAEPVPAPERPAIDINEAYPGTDHTTFPAQWSFDPDTGKLQPVDQAQSSATRQPNLDTDLYKG